VPNLASAAASDDLIAPGELTDLQRLCGEYIKEPATRPLIVDAIARALFNDVKARGICRRRAMKNGVSFNDVDEVVQRVAETFTMRMLPKLREAEGVYFVVYAIADLVSKEVSRDVLVASSDHDSLEELVENGYELPQAALGEDGEFDHDVEITARLTIAKMSNALVRRENGDVVAMNRRFAETLDALPMVSLVAPAEIEAQPDLPTKSQPKAARLSADQAELVQICSDLELRNQDYAVLLGIGLPRLSSYIYGRTASVPAEVMARARQLLAEHQESQSVRSSKFRKPMSEIVSDWETRLQTQCNEELAGYLGVTGMTIHRWRSNETKPDMTALVRYDTVVDRWVKTMSVKPSKPKAKK
jgi:hypothetical protein